MKMLALCLSFICLVITNGCASTNNVAKTNLPAGPTQQWQANVPPGVNPPIASSTPAPVYDPVEQERIKTAIMAEKAKQAQLQAQIDQARYGYNGSYGYAGYGGGYNGYGRMYPTYSSYRYLNVGAGVHVQTSSSRYSSHHRHTNNCRH